MSRLVMTLTVTSVQPLGNGDYRIWRGNYTALTSETGSDYPEETLIGWMLANSVPEVPDGATPWRVEKFTAVPVEDGHGP